MSEINGRLNSQLAEKGQPNDGLRQLKPMTADGIVHRAAKSILEPACGDGRMAEALKAAGTKVYCTDIEDRGYAGLNGLIDFTLSTPLEFQWDAISIGALDGFDGVVTNPPFGPRGKLAEAFIEAGLRRLGNGFLALLLRADFDSAKTRAHLFGHCPQFTGKIVLTRRVNWFDHPGKPNRQPKENSAWFLWGNAGLQDRRIPVIRYAPEQTCGAALP